MKKEFNCEVRQLEKWHIFQVFSEYFLLKTAVNQRQSQKHGVKSLVFLTSQTTL